MIVYLVQGFGVAENEVDRAFDEAPSKVMSAALIQQRVLRAVESAAVERCLVTGDPERHCLRSDVARQCRRSSILLRLYVN